MPALGQYCKPVHSIYYFLSTKLFFKPFSIQILVWFPFMALAWIIGISQLKDKNQGLNALSFLVSILSITIVGAFVDKFIRM